MSRSAATPRSTASELSSNAERMLTYLVHRTSRPIPTSRLALALGFTTHTINRLGTELLERQLVAIPRKRGNEKTYEPTTDGRALVQLLDEELATTDGYVPATWGAEPNFAQRVEAAVAQVEAGADLGEVLKPEPAPLSLDDVVDTIPRAQLEAEVWDWAYNLNRLSLSDYTRARLTLIWKATR